jgi:transposase
MLATALVASVADPRTFRSGRNFSAWIGLVPKQHSSGARTGSAASANRAAVTYASLFVAGDARYHPLRQDPRHQASALAHGVVRGRPTKVAAIALANKIASRIAWAMMAKGERYKQPFALAAQTRSRRTAGVM